MTDVNKMHLFLDNAGFKASEKVGREQDRVTGMNRIEIHYVHV